MTFRSGSGSQKSASGKSNTRMWHRSGWHLAGKFVLLFVTLVMLQVLLVLLVAGGRIYTYVENIVYPNLQQQTVYLIRDLRQRIDDDAYLYDLGYRLRLDFAIEKGDKRFVSDSALGVLLDIAGLQPQKPRKGRRLFRPPVPHRYQRFREDSFDDKHDDDDDYQVYDRPWQRQGLSGVFTPVEWDDRPGLLYKEKGFTVILLFDPTLVPVKSRDLWILGGGTLLLLLLSLVVTQRLLRPLRDLRRGIENLNQGRFDRQIAIRSRDELGMLSRAFNQMSSHIREQFHQREQLLTDISHELRSPLTRMRVAVEFIREKKSRTLLLEDIYQQEKLLSLLLDNARLGAITGKQALTLAALSLNELVERVIASYKNPLIVACVPPHTLVMNADVTLLPRVLVNLIDNALKYADATQPIHVSLESEGDNAVLTVTDTGAGIPVAERERVFVTFYRLDSSRSRGSGDGSSASEENGSFGLGLSLCRRIVEAHGGSIDIDPQHTSGTRIRVRLPLTEQ